VLLENWVERREDITEFVVLARFGPLMQAVKE